MLLKKDNKIFKNPTTILEEDIEKLFSKDKKKDLDLFFNVLNLLFHKNEKNSDLIDMLKILDIETFVKILYLLEGREVKFPTVDNFFDNLLLSICYYYKVVLGKSWDTIQKEFPSYKLEKLSMALKIHGLDTYIENKVQEVYKKWELEIDG